MKKIFSLFVIALLLFAIGCSKSQDSGKAVDLKTEKQKSSYAIGCDIGSNIKQIADEIDLDAVLVGIKDSTAGKEKMTPEEKQKALTAFSQILKKKMEDKRKLEGEKNRTEGEAFLKANAQKPGVKTTPSGLQYMVIKEGAGPTPKPTDIVTVHYRGTLLDGKEFDSSYKRNEPAVFPLNRVIPGWTEGVGLMKVGSTYKLFIPSELAYRETGTGNDIGPNSVLVFEVQLIDVKPAAQAQPAGQPQIQVSPTKK